MLSLNPHSGQVEAQLQQARAELSQRLRSGQDCHAEDVASGFPSVASNPNHLLELVLAELTIRRQLGQHLQPEEWYARYPQWRERLWLWFAVESEVIPDSSPNVEETVVQTPQPAPAEAEPEKVFGRYELLGKLGQGGMGVVYRARDTSLGRVVALKRIRVGVLASSDDVERFCREARAAAQLKHPYVIGLYDIDRLGDEYYLTMEYASGGSLAHCLRRFKGEPRKAVALMEKVARAVHHAHSKGILHRDLKPGNILLDENEEPRISDFGLAKFLDDDVELTQRGAVVGTPAYMAPEQTAGRPGKLCVQSDVWALGVILYELLTGRRPFLGDGSQQIVDQIQRVEPPRPRALCPKLDRDLETVILKCLEKEPAWRYPSAEALADDLARWLRGESVQARPVPWLRLAGRWLRRHPRLSTAVGGLILLAGALGAVLYLNDPDRPVRDIQARLAKGQAVTLIGETGLPRWYRWRAGSKRATLSPEPPPHGGVDAITYYLSILELLPDPQQQCYRFAAEVRMSGTVTGEVGLYLLGEERPTAHGREQYCCALTFADRGVLAGRAILKLFRVWEVNGEQRQREELYMQEIPLPPKQALRLSQALTAQALAIPAGMIPAYPGVYTAAGVAALGVSQCEWRQLVVDVTPEGIDASLDGCRVGKLDQAQLRAAAAAWWRVQAQIPAGTPPPLLNVRGSLGLLVKTADASFRNVTVSPLPRVTPH